MPTYQYECDDCGYSFNKWQSIKEPKLKECPKCKKSSVHRLIGRGGGLVFKGDGFYETDYKNKNSDKNSCPLGKESKCKVDCPAKKSSSNGNS